MSRQPDPGPLEDALAYQIHRTARLLRYHLLGFFRRQEVDITPEQWFILYRLNRQDRLSQSDLTDRAIDDRANITRLVDALEKRQLVARHPDPDDRRRSLVGLTDRGRDLVERLLPLVFSEREELFGELGAEDERRLRKALGIVQKRSQSA